MSNANSLATHRGPGLPGAGAAAGVWLGGGGLDSTGLSHFKGWDIDVFGVKL